jgi:transcriptional regulator with XRE-family HTH domain
MMNKRQRDKLRKKDHRDAFTDVYVDTTIAFQIRALRQQRKWSQRKLGEKLGGKGGQAQPLVSRLEAPGRTRYSLSTLKRLASAFDVSLMVRFVPYGQWTRHMETLAPDTYQVPSFREEVAAAEAAEEIGSSNLLKFPEPTSTAVAARTRSVPIEGATLTSQPIPALTVQASADPMARYTGTGGT